MRILAVLSALSAVSGTFAPAHANERNAVAASANPPARETPAPATPNAESGAPTGDVEAARWYALAEDQWAKGDLRGARTSLESAYRWSPRIELLFNLGQLNRELGDCGPSIHYYRSYLARGSGAREDDARSALASLEQSCAPSTPAALPAHTAPTPPEPDYWTAARIGGWATIGTGVLAAAGATYFVFSAANAERDLEAMHSRVDGMIPPWDAAAQERQSDGEHAENLARILGTTALVLITGGTVLVLTNPTPSPAPRKGQLSLGISHSRARVDYTVAF